MPVLTLKLKVGTIEAVRLIEGILSKAKYGFTNLKSRGSSYIR